MRIVSFFYLFVPIRDTRERKECKNAELLKSAEPVGEELLSQCASFTASPARSLIAPSRTAHIHTITLGLREAVKAASVWMFFCFWGEPFELFQGTLDSSPSGASGNESHGLEASKFDTPTLTPRTHTESDEKKIRNHAKPCVPV